MATSQVSQSNGDVPVTWLEAGRPKPGCWQGWFLREALRERLCQAPPGSCRAGGPSCPLLQTHLQSLLCVHVARSRGVLRLPQPVSEGRLFKTHPKSKMVSSQILYLDASAENLFPNKCTSTVPRWTCLLGAPTLPPAGCCRALVRWVGAVHGHLPSVPPGSPPGGGPRPTPVWLCVCRWMGRSSPAWKTASRWWYLTGATGAW